MYPILCGGAGVWRRVIGGLALLMLVAGGTGAQQPAGASFYRFVSPTETAIIGLSWDGLVTWSGARPGTTGVFERSTGVSGARAWLDYVQCIATGSVMSLRLFDLSPPAGMTLVPAGTNIGIDPNFGAYALAVEEFHMDRAHVTIERWDQVRSWGSSNGYEDLPEGVTHGARNPVHHVNWYDAVKWCNARSESEGRPVSYRVEGAVYRMGQTNAIDCDFTVAGYRLPTIREWEYAARGGLREKPYPWGETIDETRLNFQGNVDQTTVAGFYKANGYGLFDMAGNLNQWTWDWLPGYEGSFRVFKGGSWQDGAEYCRIMRSSFGSPAVGAYVIGFRTVLPAQR